MRVDVKKTLDGNETLAILEDDLKYIVQLHIACLCMRSYFKTTRIYFDVVTYPWMTDLSAKAENVKINAIPINKVEESLQLTLESCAKTHHSDKIYVQVSDNHLREDEASNDIKEILANVNNELLSSPVSPSPESANQSNAPNIKPGNSCQRRREHSLLFFAVSSLT